jgi:hypothetical protein
MAVKPSSVACTASALLLAFLATAMCALPTSSTSFRSSFTAPSTWGQVRGRWMSE